MDKPRGSIRVSNVREGEHKVVGENRLPSQLIQTNQGQPQVVDIRYLPSKEINRQTHYDPNERVTENRLQERVNRPSLSQHLRTKQVDVNAERAVINEIVVEKKSFKGFVGKRG